MSRTNLKPTIPTTGTFPTITYEYTQADESVDSLGIHEVRCGCGEHVETSHEGTARYFASSHIAEHARRRIVTPEIEPPV